MWIDVSSLNSVEPAQKLVVDAKNLRPGIKRAAWHADLAGSRVLEADQFHRRVNGVAAS